MSRQLGHFDANLPARHTKPRWDRKTEALGSITGNMQILLRDHRDWRDELGSHQPRSRPMRSFRRLRRGDIIASTSRRRHQAEDPVPLFRRLAMDLRPTGPAGRLAFNG